jgi:hypothetical protein
MGMLVGSGMIFSYRKTKNFRKILLLIGIAQAALLLMGCGVAGSLPHLTSPFPHRQSIYF